jgi:hypothetical protein
MLPLNGNKGQVQTHVLPLVPFTQGSCIPGKGVGDAEGRQGDNDMLR